MGILQKIRGFFTKAENAGGDVVGDAENILHHPLYPIKPYVKVVDQVLLRGSWPTPEVVATLKRMGVTRVFNLCSERADAKIIRAADMESFCIPIEDNSVPSNQQISDFLRLASAHVSLSGVIGMSYVHCEQGVGRTGCMVAAYRVRMQGWTPQQALAEAKSFGLAIPKQQQFILSL